MKILVNSRKKRKNQHYPFVSCEYYIVLTSTLTHDNSFDDKMKNEQINAYNFDFKIIDYYYLVSFIQ